MLDESGFIVGVTNAFSNEPTIAGCDGSDDFASLADVDVSAVFASISLKNYIYF